MCQISANFCPTTVHTKSIPKSIIGRLKINKGLSNITIIVSLPPGLSCFWETNSKWKTTNSGELILDLNQVLDLIVDYVLRKIWSLKLLSQLPHSHNVFIFKFQISCGNQQLNLDFTKNIFNSMVRLDLNCKIHTVKIIFYIA